MKYTNTQKGFTLVELAIVMTIIGLLIGGILKGQELMQNARVTATIAQVRGYEAATTTFRDKYDALPGDMANASARIPGCTAACDPPTTANATGTGNDQFVGLNNWTGTQGGGLAKWKTQTTGAGTTAPATATVGSGESYLFWVHLLKADLISGVTDAALNTGAYAFGSTHPAAKIAGGFIAGWGTGGATPGNSLLPGPSGLLLVLVSSPTTDVTSTAAIEPLTATRAAQIDRKMDDGAPNNGYVQAYGYGLSCFSVLAPFTPASPGYLESGTANDCGLVFRIQG